MEIWPIYWRDRRILSRMRSSSFQSISRNRI